MKEEAKPVRVALQSVGARHLLVASVWGLSGRTFGF